MAKSVVACSAVLATTLMLAGCQLSGLGAMAPSGTLAASPSARSSSVALRRYFFPFTAAYRAVYLLDDRDPGLPPYVPASESTRDQVVTVVAYTSDAATLSYAFTATDSSLVSFSVRPDGSVDEARPYSFGTTASTASYGPGLLIAGASVSIVPSSASITMTQVGTESVTVPAGTYMALKFAYGVPGLGVGSTVYAWWAPDVGMVKQRIDDVIASATYSTETDLVSLSR